VQVAVEPQISRRLPVWQVQDELNGKGDAVDYYTKEAMEQKLVDEYYGKNEMEALLSDKSDVGHTHDIVDVAGLQVPAWQSPVCYTLAHAVQFGRSRKLAHPRSGASTLTASLPAPRVCSVCRRR
jgi:hypothetical protein